MKTKTTISSTFWKATSLILSLVFLTITTSIQAATIYVDVDATGANDGTSWTDAFTNLSTAISSASSGDDIWLAEGVYKPSYVGDRSASFQFFVDVNIYGGFRGTETSPGERNWALYKSILSGNIGAQNDETDNSYHVIYNIGADIILNGLIIQKANADGTGLDDKGAILISGGSVNLRNSVVRNNYATGNVIHNLNGDLNMYNCLIHENETESGMIIASGGLTSTFYAEHVTIAYNHSLGSFSVWNTYLNNPLTLTNSIVWENTGFGGSISSQPVALLQHNIIEGGFTSSGNDVVVNLWDIDPMFSDPLNFDFTLEQGSPAIDQSDPTYTTTSNDLARNERTQNGTADLGAYEAPQVIYVDHNASGANDGSSWADAYTDLQLALNIGNSGQQIWVAEGTYKPTDGTDREETFTTFDGNEIYGGFNGTEGSLSQRDWKTNPTILSGDIGSIGHTDNSYNVIRASLGGGTCTLDGFIIEGGNADGPTTITSSGSAIRAGLMDMTVRHCIIRDNLGEGGIFLVSDRFSLESVLIHDNDTGASTFNIGSFSARCEINHVTITENTVGVSDYLFTNGYSGYEIITANSIFYANSGILEIMPPSPDVSVSHCIIGSGFTPGAGDDVTNLFTSNPQFVNPALDGFALSPGSPAINGGDNDALRVAEDLFGESRIQNGTVDIGAFETPILGYNVIYVDQDATGANDGSSWQDAYTDLQDALAADATGDHIWVAQGTYLPSTTNDRAERFILQKDRSLIGSFKGVETSPDHRIFGVNLATLSGDIGTPGDMSDNSYHVLLLTEDNGVHVIDRFMISNGNADGTSTNGWGGGLFTGNSTAVLASDLYFFNNYASVGGAIYSGYQSQLTLNRAYFAYNENAISVTTPPETESMELINALAYDNTGNYFIQLSSPEAAVNLKHCTLVDNAVDNVWIGNGTTNCYNSILDNTGSLASVNNLLHHCISDAEVYLGFLTEVEVFDLDPQFTNPALGNYTIDAMSPAFDAADPFYGAIDDVIHVSRPFHGLPDIGCFEATSCFQDYDLCTQAEEIHIDTDTLFNSTRCAVPDGYAPMSCETETGRNVWYYFEGPLSGTVEVFLDYIYGFGSDSDLSFEVYTDGCGTLTQLDCINAGADGVSETAVIEDLQNGGAYWIRIETPEDEDASFTLFIAEIPGESCPGDFDGNGLVNSADLLTFLGEFGCSSNCTADINGDGSVNSADLLAFLGVMGSVCPS